MGYNNNHAGMHMIWYRHYGTYDNLDYYDKYSETIANRKKKEPVKKTNSVEVMTNFDTNNDQKTELEVTVEIKNAQESNVTKKTNQHKNKKTNKTYNKKQPEYGKEQLIDLHQLFELPHVVMANIMILAMQRKKDIRMIMKETEALMKNDFRTNPAPDTNWSWMPKLETSLIFLSILAEKLECGAYDLFIDDEKRRKRFVCKLLEELKEDAEYWEGWIEESGEAEISISSFDFVYHMTTEFADIFDERMTLSITKEIFDDGEVNYALSFGNLIVKEKTKYDYMTKGAYLWEEKEGILKDFMENILQHHPEWKE